MPLLASNRRALATRSPEVLALLETIAPAAVPPPPAPEEPAAFLAGLESGVEEDLSVGLPFALTSGQAVAAVRAGVARPTTTKAAMISLRKSSSSTVLPKS